MRNTTTLYTAAVLVALNLMPGSPAYSQDSRWFRVELLVFANQAPADQTADAATAEQWEPLPALAYPGAARFLIYPELVAENLRAHPGSSLVDEYGRQIITLPAPEPAQPQPLEPAGIAPLRPVIDPDAVAAAPDIPRPPGDEQPQDPNATQAPGEAIPAETAPQGPVLPRPFMVLPAPYLEFRGKAALMQRGGRYAVLFHESWVQPVSGEAQSLPIVLDRSGDTGQWPRLQGSIKFYLSRYLQVETNLWLNTSGSYLPGNWQMSAPPLAPPSLIIEEPLPPIVDVGEAGEAAESGAEDSATDALAVTGAAGDASASGPEPPEGQPAAPPSPTDEDPLAEVIPELEPGPVYPYRHAVLMQQNRRMRSNEVHYIDHPLLGVVIKFTPVGVDELAAIAAEQSPLPAGQQP